jgi:very-short-patch-repair endonuclease
MSKPDRLEQYIRECAEHHAVRYEEECHHIVRHCESPIEKLLMAALFSEAREQPFTQVFLEEDEPFPDKPSFGEAAFIYNQVKFGPYRVDFAIWDASLPLELADPRIMIVECDGHDFHERTKQQARRDKQRDRYFQSKGFKVLRFTGSEIYADPTECAQEIIGELAIDDGWRNRKK